MTHSTNYPVVTRVSKVIRDSKIRITHLNLEKVDSKSFDAEKELKAMRSKDPFFDKKLSLRISKWGEIVQKSIGLSNWGITCDIVFDGDNHEGVVAEVMYHLLNRAAHINFYFSSYQMWKDDYGLAKTIFHELMHLYLAPLALKSSGPTLDNMQDWMEHDIIRSFENYLFGPLWEVLLSQYCQDVKRYIAESVPNTKKIVKARNAEKK